jgi:hypothetical protein
MQIIQTGYSINTFTHRFSVNDAFVTSCDVHAWQERVHAHVARCVHSGVISVILHTNCRQSQHKARVDARTRVVAAARSTSVVDASPGTAVDVVLVALVVAAVVDDSVSIGLLPRQTIVASASFDAVHVTMREIARTETSVHDDDFFVLYTHTRERALCKCINRSLTRSPTVR